MRNKLISERIKLLLKINKKKSDSKEKIYFKSKNFSEVNIDYNSNIKNINKNSFFIKISKDKRIIPNIMLRSSLFSVIRKGYRKYERNILKTSLNGFDIRFTGESLDQTDLDVWLECLYRLTKVPLGKRVIFSTYSFLKSIDRKTGKKDYEWLKSSLIRLSICSIEIKYKNNFYIGHLLHEWYRNSKTKKNIILLNKNIITLFMDSMWTAISLKERKKLKGKPLSQWIHCFFCSHNIPLYYKVSTLKKLCGSNTSLLWKFRQILKKSLHDVSLATGWKCWIDYNDIVHIIKK
ncbi:plasmid replication initiator TrfA [Enterobacteriaceae endosymbiont of Donacia semicuprea]|uniref:plasmid replication initiator TrfA n=1 Tax=Enterobacteriaceae endosymbiont of Donacia semicuprea TaxID=2675783 RepID=UPI0014494029|nr:plasmid replication initiator TrfA [Enterobacteriaceae endosymbiont of Donacia semicuprea]QJC33104.1 hypothetical protein GJT91_02235 [Enterobacteriaceae endosymbiont of Donacia semicuprea]